MFIFVIFHSFGKPNRISKATSQWHVSEVFLPFRQLLSLISVQPAAPKDLYCLSYIGVHVVVKNNG